MQISTYSINENYAPCQLTAYVADPGPEMPYNAKRPVVLVCPGGAYYLCSAREAEPIAMTFYAKGYNVFVLNYVEKAELEYPVHLRELAASVGFIKDRAEEFHIDPDRIFLIGFSAGAHLAASMGVFWNREDLYEGTPYQRGYFRVAGMMLCYPVITSGEKANRGSFINLLKERANDPKWLDEVSLEKQVGPDTAPAYIWHTADDPGVPVENALYFCEALSAHHVPYELHIYPHGPHGMSLCDKQTGMPDPYVATWVDEALHFLENLS
ncbi:MAG: alpha/beta hydrolase [Clostridia bacterium]|nr:alpha/beta hydrolase [Clostridia bacterium]